MSKCTEAHLDGISLLLVHVLQCSAEEPRAFVVFDVRANLADDLGVAIAIKVIILDLHTGEWGGRADP